MEKIDYVIFLMKILILLCCFAYVCGYNASPNCREATVIRDKILENSIMPRGVTKSVSECLELKQQQRTNLMILGSIAGLLFAPVIAPLFAVNGLFGAAAVSNGLAALGGGSLAAGGLGMIGGSLVLNAAGAFIGYSAVKSGDCYQPKQVFDVIYIGYEIVYQGDIYGILPSGYGTMYFESSKYEGKFVNGLPEPCK